jgi:hypothetical protein
MAKENNGVSQFTGRIFHPVVVRKEGRLVEIFYTPKVGPSEHNECEDWSLQIEAHERRNDTYDVRVQGIFVENITGHKGALRYMARFIDEQGNFKGLENQSQSI